MTNEQLTIISEAVDEAIAYIYDSMDAICDEDSIKNLSFMGRNSVYSGKFDEIWKDIEVRLKQWSVDKQFLKQINGWRLMLGKEIYNAYTSHNKSSNESIDMERLNDEVQSYINKILFLRVCEDRSIETYKDLLAIADGGNFDKLLEKFRKADTKYNSGLFDQALSDKVVCNASSKMSKTAKKNVFLPKYLGVRNKYITFAA